MHTIDTKRPQMTSVMRSTLDALRAAGCEITAQSLAGRLGLVRSTVFVRLCRLEDMGLVVSRLVPGKERRGARLFQIRKGRKKPVLQEWEYDAATRLITVCDRIGKRYLVASQVNSRHARIIFGLINVAKTVAKTTNPSPFGCKKDCQCVACTSRRLLVQIGGEE